MTLPEHIWTIYFQVAMTACTTKDFAIAEKFFAAAIDISASHKALRNLESKSLIGFADAVFLQKRISTAEAVYKKALRRLQHSNNRPEEKWQLAYVLEKLGHIQRINNRPAEALVLLKKAYRVLCSFLSAEHHSIQRVGHYIALLGLECGRPDLAAKHYQIDAASHCSKQPATPPQPTAP